MFIPSDSWESLSCIPWNKAVEVEGGGEEGPGSDLKSLYIYSPRPSWLSSIRRLMGSIFLLE